MICFSCKKILSSYIILWGRLKKKHKHKHKKDKETSDQTVQDSPEPNPESSEPMTPEPTGEEEME